MPSTFLAATGPWLYPLLAVAACLVLAAGRAAHTIHRSSPSRSSGAHHSVIVWGVLAGVVGLLGTVIGFGRVAVGARAVTGGESAQIEAMLAVMWDGVLVILTPITFGLWLLTISLVAWLALDALYRSKSKSHSDM